MSFCTDQRIIQLADNVWHNPLEVLDGTDTDGNGYIDDINGWDAADNDNNGGGRFASGRRN